MRILFQPKKGSGVAGPTDAQWISRHYGAAGFDSGKPVSDSSALRCKSADLITPRRVVGQSKAVTAECYYATALWTGAMKKRELARRF